MPNDKHVDFQVTSGRSRMGSAAVRRTRVKLRREKREEIVKSSTLLTMLTEMTTIFQ
jgi:hypothetical protein